MQAFDLHILLLSGKPHTDDSRLWRCESHDRFIFCQKQTEALTTCEKLDPRIDLTLIPLEGKIDFLK